MKRTVNSGPKQLPHNSCNQSTTFNKNNECATSNFLIVCHVPWNNKSLKSKILTEVVKRMNLSTSLNVFFFFCVLRKMHLNVGFNFCWDYWWRHTVFFLLNIEISAFDIFISVCVCVCVRERESQISVCMWVMCLWDWVF